jgi:MurNAc alpha-1-phosphate uridylyltransferase
MRINTAFILCAGFGKRLNPLTLDTPKPLIKFKNISVLETCINLIESLGYTANRFEYFLFKRTN